MMVSIVLLLALIDGLVSASSYNTSVFSHDVVETTADEETVNVITTDLELIKLMQTKKVIYKGKVDGVGRFEDLNGTQYLIKIPTPEEREEEIRTQLNDKNHTGRICSLGRCYDRDTAAKVLDQLERKNSMWIQADQEIPFIITLTVLSVAAIIGITGNMLILIGVFKSTKLRTSTGVLLCSLAVSDILVLGACLPLQVIRKYFQTFAFTTIHVCRMFELFKHLSIVVSTFTMAAMCVERYIAICHPLKAKSYCTVANARKVTVVVWFLSLSLSLPTIFLTYQNEDRAYCKMVFDSVVVLQGYYAGVLVVVFAIPVLIMSPLYIKIFVELRRSSRQILKLQSTENGKEGCVDETSESVRTRQQVVKMLVLVLMVFVLCWGPPTVFDCINRIYRTATAQLDTWTGIASYVLNTIGFCNSLFNPLIYIAMSRQFRVYLKSLLSCKIDKKQGSEDSRPKTGVPSDITQSSRVSSY